MIKIDNHEIETLNDREGRVQVWEVCSDGISEYVGRFETLDIDEIRKVLSIPPQHRHQH